MKQYRVVVTDKAESALDRYIGYLADVKKNEQAANNLFYDYIETRKELERVAGSIKALTRIWPFAEIVEMNYQER